MRARQVGITQGCILSIQFLINMKIKVISLYNTLHYYSDYTYVNCS